MEKMIQRDLALHKAKLGLTPQEVLTTNIVVWLFFVIKLMLVLIHLSLASCFSGSFSRKTDFLKEVGE